MSTAAPLAPSERIEAIDVVRGFALLGILLMNILAFGLPFRAYFDPSVDGAVAGVDFGVFFAVDLFAEGAMRAVFSMLFGAGVVILATGDRAKGAAIYYRRQLLLLAIGLFDAFVLLWMGDILVPYALAGMLLYLCRNWSPRALFAASGLVFAYLLVFYAVLFATLNFMPAQAAAVEERIAAGETVTAGERAMVAEWADLKATFRPPPDVQALEVRRFEGTYPESFVANAVAVLDSYAVALPLFMLWDAVACMLLGMALFKIGVLQGQRSVRFYTVLAACGFAVGLGVNAFELSMKTGSGFALPWVSGASSITNDIGRVAMALGYISLAMIVCLRGWLDLVRRGLAAVGRMALTNYLLQSTLGVVIFHSLGFGLWNELPRHQLYYVVLLEWVVSIGISIWWLRRYRYGPLEWLWRALTYGRLPRNRL